MFGAIDRFFQVVLEILKRLFREKPKWERLAEARKKHEDIKKKLSLAISRKDEMEIAYLSAAIIDAAEQLHKIQNTER